MSSFHHYLKKAFTVSRVGLPTPYLKEKEKKSCQGWPGGGAGGRTGTGGEGRKALEVAGDHLPGPGHHHILWGRPPAAPRRPWRLPRDPAAGHGWGFSAGKSRVGAAAVPSRARHILGVGVGGRPCCCPGCTSPNLSRTSVILRTHRVFSLTATCSRHCSLFFFFFILKWNRCISKIEYFIRS